MVWESQTIYANWGYRPITKPAIKWHQVSNGDWRGSDRGAGEDTFEAQMLFRDDLTELTVLESVLDSNRGKFSATFSTGEEIFGADLDYTSAYDVTVINYGKIRKVAYKVYEMPLTLRLVDDPTFVSTAASLATLRKSSHADTRESEFDLTKYFTYDRFDIVTDHQSDPGTYTAEFTQTQSEAEAIRRYLLTTARANTISNFFDGASPPFDNIQYPFGTREGNGQFDVKIIDWRDLGRPNLCDWKFSITFAREF